MNLDERDMLIRIDENLIHLKEWSEGHEKKDDNRFQELRTQVGWMTKILFMGLGAFAVIKFFLK